MQVGDLVRVKNTTTGDSSNMVRLYREGVPLLLISKSVAPSGLYTVLDGSTRFQLVSWRLEVVNHANR